jgi:CO/xanthine dehydrogenase Mo-binding subunit
MNAVADATGKRLRDLLLARKRIKSAIDQACDHDAYR